LLVIISLSKECIEDESNDCNQKNAYDGDLAVPLSPLLLLQLLRLLVEAVGDHTQVQGLLGDNLYLAVSLNQRFDVLNHIFFQVDHLLENLICLVLNQLRIFIVGLHLRLQELTSESFQTISLRCLDLMLRVLVE